MEIFEGTLEIISTAGESQLGGEDFTDRLVSAVYRRESLQLETAEMKFPLRTARLRQECEKAKTELATTEKTRIRIPDDAGLFDDGKAISIDRSTFFKISDSLVKRIQNSIGKVLRDGEKDTSDIDDIILVGGATRMALMSELVEEYFEQKPQMTFNPDEVVVMGAAIQAALIGDDKAVEDMVMTDVCPFTLGVEVVKQFGSHVTDGYFQPIIDRNTTIPVSREEIFSTVVANQPQVNLRVYEGEGRKVKDNLLLGELSVTDIPPGPAGQPIHVRFTYDINGLLEVEAIIPETGQRTNIVLTNHCSNLSEREIKKATANLKKLKFYPRDDLKNKKLVLFCERMVGEVSTFHRKELEESIDMFEHAMSSGDSNLFDAAKQGLMVTLSRLGIEYSESNEGN